MWEGTDYVCQNAGYVFRVQLRTVALKAADVGPPALPT